MNRYMFIGLLCLVQQAFNILSAQEWSREDSLWLQNIRAGTDTLRLNPEFQKAIKEGSFINTGTPPGRVLLDAPSVLPILKDFSEYVKNDSTLNDSIRHIDITSVPPCVFLLYHGGLDSVPRINSEAYTPQRTLLPKEEIKIGKLPVGVGVGARNLYSKEVRDGQRRGTITATGRVYFSLEDLLRSIFWKSERNKKRNLKRAKELVY